MKFSVSQRSKNYFLHFAAAVRKHLNRKPRRVVDDDKRVIDVKAAVGLSSSIAPVAASRTIVRHNGFIEG